MADFTDIVLFLSTGRAIAWIGAGPSIELGLPDWRGLAADVLEACRRQQRHNFGRIERYYREGKYLDQFDEVELTYGRQFLLGVCRNKIADLGCEGAMYKEIAKLDFLSYFTTNYDDILLRHLESMAKAVAVYGNSQEDLETVDVDMVPALVKLHGDFSEPDSVVLSRSDYQKLYLSGQGEGFRTFLKSHLARDRILFLGYSLSDPEILHIQENLAVNLKRKVSPIAILANCPDEEIDLWKRRYNIDVVPYSAQGSDHSRLTSMLSSVANVVSTGPLAKQRISDEDLRRAQALYMWYRFSTSSAKGAAIDALQSLLMTSLVDLGGKATPQMLAAKVSSDFGASVSPDSDEFIGAVNQLMSADWVIQEDGFLLILSEGKQLVVRYERQFSRLIDVFSRQLYLDLKGTFAVEDDDAHNLTQVVLDALIDIFELRGQNIMEMVFDNRPIDPQSITDMLQALWRRANTLDDPRARSSLVGFVLNILTKPSPVYENVLNYLAKSFFCIQAMRLDPAVPEFVSRVISDRTLLIDENVLIPLTAKYEDRHEFVSRAIRKARETNLSLFTTKRFVDSVRRHSDWALNRVTEYGTQSEEVMRAARGEGDYLPNAFLKGFIDQDPDDPDRDFLEYLRDCFGGSYTRESFDRYFEDELGIRILDVSRMAEFIQSKSDQHAEAVHLLNEWNESRSEDARKSVRRIESEVEALLLLANWTDAKESVPSLTSSRISFITSGSSVPRLARWTNVQPTTMMVASTEAIWELLSQSAVPTETSPSFRSMMLASHFRLAGHFVQVENYQRFFQPLIANARQEFQETRELLEDALGTELGSRFLDDFNDEDLPGVVSSLQLEAVHKSTEREYGQRRLIEENERLRAMLDDYRGRERRRRDYIARQRESQQRRTSR